MEDLTITADRITSMDSCSRAVLALTTTGVLGGALHESDRQSLAADEAMAVVEALTKANVPPIAVDDEGVPLRGL